VFIIVNRSFFNSNRSSGLYQQEPGFGLYHINFATLDTSGLELGNFKSNYAVGFINKLYPCNLRTYHESMATLYQHLCSTGFGNIS
jgi:hypothetical protein